MAQRDDITVRWDLLPRLITVAAPSTELIIQDFHDTLRELEQRPGNLIYPSIIETSGGEPLGGDVTVGLTSELQNAEVKFESRYTRTSDGYSDINSSIGDTIFTDNSATFISDGVLRGATITNFDDQSYGTVVKVISETQLEHEPLQDGLTNSWTIGDYYKIHNEIQCEITGGNLVAVDGYGNAIEPASPSAFVQLVRTSASSATSRNSQDIEFASFEGAVHVDLNNVTGRADSGTSFPSGTHRQPVNNFADALQILSVRGFGRIRLHGDAIVDSGLNFSDITFIGDSMSRSHITINSSANVFRCEFEEMSVDGTLDGYSTVRHCEAQNLLFFDGFIENSALFGTITLSGNREANIVNCWDGTAGLEIPIIDMGGSGQSLVLRNYNGGIKLINKNGNDSVSMDVDPGRIILDSTITAGDIVVRGVGTFIDDSNGADVISDDFLQASSLTQRATQIKYLIEGLRSHHSGVGNHFYWDPINGADTNSGVLPKFARQTFQSIHDDLVIDGNHDVVHIISDDFGQGPIIINEFVNITKNWVFLRGPGRDIALHPPNDSQSTITVDGYGVQISGFRVEAGLGSSQSAIEISASSDFVEIINMWVSNTTGHGVNILGGDYHILDNNILSDIDGYAVNMNNSSFCQIKNNNIFSCDVGVLLQNSGQNNDLVGNIIRQVITNSIDIGPGLLNTFIRINNFVEDDFPIIDNGTDTIIEKDISNINVANTTRNSLIPFFFS